MNFYLNNIWNSNKMPEGVEVAIKTNELRIFMEKNGNTITSLNYDEKSRYFIEPGKNYSNREINRKKLKGYEYLSFPLIVKKIYSRGKLIIIECQKLYIVIHLGMTGNFIFSDTLNRAQKTKHANLWFTINDKIIYFEDPRKFGSVTIYQSLVDLFKKNGPCLMTSSLLKYQKIKLEDLSKNQPYVSRRYWHSIITRKNIENKTIAEFLLAQKYFSGIGNYLMIRAKLDHLWFFGENQLRAEILYDAKISPKRLLRDLSEEDRNILYDVTLKIMYLAYKYKGISDGYIEGGSFSLKVYMQKKDRHGNPVITYSDKDNRTVHYVAVIQK